MSSNCSPYSSLSAIGRTSSMEITCQLNPLMYLVSFSVADSAESAQVVTFMNPLVRPDGMSPVPSEPQQQVSKSAPYDSIPDSCDVCYSPSCPPGHRQSDDEAFLELGLDD